MGDLINRANSTYIQIEINSTCLIKIQNNQNKILNCLGKKKLTQYIYTDETSTASITSHIG